MFAGSRIILILAAVLALLTLTMSFAQAQGSAERDRNVSDNLKHPLGSMQHALRQKVLEKQLRGEAVPEVAQVDGKYVETTMIKKDRIWTVVGEFGNQINATYGGDVGPVHNQIPEPDRNVDNRNIWVPDFDQSHFEQILFDNTPGASSMHNFYKEQSSGLYTVTGEVTDWVQVPYNEANYGSDYCGSITCARTWLFVRDVLNAWYNQQIANGMSQADINAALAKYDVWDRYDYNGNGNFNEPDGYIDHFQTIHAGMGQETGGGPQGTNAIWSHRWYAFYGNIGSTGPSFNKFGGVQVGQSNFWVGDYTIEPENGGVGVFAHEFGDDLNLPDLYDTSGNTGGAENSTGWWTIMSQGSYGASGKPEDALGTKPIGFSALEKIFLGWAKTRWVNYGNDRNVWLGPAEWQTDDFQNLVVQLPTKYVDTNVGTPNAGSFFYYSGKGNDLDNSMTRQVTLPAGNPSLSAKIRYDIETDWDYFYVTVNGNGVVTNRSTNTNPNGQNFGNGITGNSGGNYVDLTADLTAFAGQSVAIGFRYWTDGATVGDGVSVDDVAISGQSADGAETDPGWTYDGFVRTNGTVTTGYYNAYMAEYRQYLGFDEGLQTGPYNFGFLDNPDLQNWVEHFPYQDGLLVW